MGRGGGGLGGVGERRIFLRVSLDFVEQQKGRSVVTENPEGGSLKTLERFRGRSNLLGK